MPFLARALLLSAAGLAAGLAANGLSPRPARLSEPVRSAAEEVGACRVPERTSLVPRISVQDAAPMCVACSAGFVDARTAAEYGAGHVSGALHLAPGEVPLTALLELERFRTVVVYDGDPFSGRAEEVAQALRRRGLMDVRILAGAWPAWLAAGAPGESGACASCSLRSAGGMP